MERSIASICCVLVQQYFLRHRFILVCAYGSQGGTGRLKASQGSRSTSGHLCFPIRVSVFGWQMTGGSCCCWFSVPCRESPESLPLSVLLEWLSNVSHVLMQVWRICLHEHFQVKTSNLIWIKHPSPSVKSSFQRYKIIESTQRVIPLLKSAKLTDFVN